MTALLGCIADDFTGATDIAGNLTTMGFRTKLLLGAPASGAYEAEDCDAIVVGLKSRTSPVTSAIGDSIASLRWLQRVGCTKVIFKYCSTFDSRPTGNIGPVASALLRDVGSDVTVFVPSYPGLGRTVYSGNLFVEGIPLAETGMRHHPLTPMTDSDIVRVLQAQSVDRVGLVPWSIVRQGADVVRQEIRRFASDGIRFVVADAIEQADVDIVADATSDLPLITGSAALAFGLNAPVESLHRPIPRADSALKAILIGSRSTASSAQLRHVEGRFPHAQIIPDALLAGYEQEVDRVSDKLITQLGADPVVLSVAPDGSGANGDLIEKALAEVGARLYERGVRSFLLAGGETSGAVLRRIGITSLDIGLQASPGVPWTSTVHEGEVCNFLLKSGNFGRADLFESAWAAV